MQAGTTHRILRERMAYSGILMLVYLLGRSIPIPWVEYQRAEPAGEGIQAVAMSFLGSSTGKTSLFSLGLMPWVTAMVMVTVFQKTAADKTEKKSPGRANRITLSLALLFAVGQSLVQAAGMTYRPWGNLRVTDLWLLTSAVLIGGSCLIRWLVGRNQTYGVGGQTLIILVNILGNLKTTASEVLQSLFEVAGAGSGPQGAQADRHDFWGITVSAGQAGQMAGIVLAAAGAFLAVCAVMVFLEGAEFRNTVRRVGINNLYAQDDYIAIRLFPAGTMPVMYVMSLFTIPYYVLRILQLFWPDRAWMEQGIAVLNLNNTAGVLIFGGFLLALTAVLSMIFVSPGEIARNLEQQGDYIDYLEPGRETAWRLRGETLTAAFIGGMSSCLLMIPPLLVRAWTGSRSGIYMAPMTVMVAAGMALELLEEAKVYRTMENYRPFL